MLKQDKPEVVGPPAGGRFVRKIAGANFSLEANTENTPGDEAFYLLENGAVAFRSESYPEALEQYQKLCVQHWEAQLESSDIDVRLRAARGLYGVSPDHKDARTILREEGDESDAKRIRQVEQRRRFAGRKAEAAAAAAAPKDDTEAEEGDTEEEAEEEAEA